MRKYIRLLLESIDISFFYINKDAKRKEKILYLTVCYVMSRTSFRVNPNLDRVNHKPRPKTPTSHDSNIQYSRIMRKYIRLLFESIGITFFYINKDTKRKEKVYLHFLL